MQIDKAAINQLPPEKKKVIAVSYLIRAKEERPEGTEKLFEKLAGLEKSANDTNAAIRNTEVSLNELNSRFMQIMGSLQTVTELIAEMLPDEKVNEWCDKYEPPKNLPQMPSSVSMPGQRRVVNPGKADMAGVTTKEPQT